MTIEQGGGLRVEPLDRGAIWQVSLATPKANMAAAPTTMCTAPAYCMPSG